MTLFLAAQTPVVVIINRSIVLTILVFIILELDVFGELAPQGVLMRFTAAPPHLTRPLAVVRPTRPVEVVLVFVVAFTVSTHFATHVHPSVLLPFKFLYLNLNFVFLAHKLGDLKLLLLRLGLLSFQLLGPLAKLCFYCLQFCFVFVFTHGLEHLCRVSVMTHRLKLTCHVIALGH